jgi:DNA-binding SARP family transcriptional activator
MTDQTPPRIAALNACFFDDPTASEALQQALGHLPCGGARMLVISDRRRALPPERTASRLSPSDIGLDQDSLAPEEIAQTLISALTGLPEDQPRPDGLLIDMSWLSAQVQGAQAIALWGRVADRVSETTGIDILSRYNRDFLIADQLRAVFAAHAAFVAPSGLYPNPYWLPEDLRRQTQAQQMSFVLGRIVPDFQGQAFFERDDRFAARGADPDWLHRKRGVEVAPEDGQGWQVYCLGQLRVYRSDGGRIDWRLKGGAPKKTRTLFVYLLTRGEKGAHVDRLAELLWPDENDETVKRARLHHTVAMLRKTLGDPETVVRTGEFYRLALPAGSWIDITSFEQLCRRGMSLSMRGQRAEALAVYNTAERLYSGDLFADIPVKYLEDNQEDWCMNRRVWFRDMALKLQSHMAGLLRGQGRLREALEHCQKALALDPSNDDANMEAMRVFHAQGRFDAVGRQYKQYRKAMQSIDATPEGTEVQALFLALTSR